MVLREVHTQPVSFHLFRRASIILCLREYWKFQIVTAKLTRNQSWATGRGFPARRGPARNWHNFMKNTLKSQKKINFEKVKAAAQLCPSL